MKDIFSELSQLTGPLGPCPNCDRPRPDLFPTNWRQVDHSNECLNWVRYADGRVECDGPPKEKDDAELER